MSEASSPAVSGDEEEITMPVKKAASSPAHKRAGKAQARKNVGDVLGVSTARVPKGTPRATKDRGGNPKGIELPAGRRVSGRLRPSRVRG